MGKSLVRNRLRPPPPQDRVTFLAPPLLKDGNFLRPPSVWLKPQASAEKLPQNILRHPPGGATQSRKGYQLWSNLSGAVAVTSQDCYKKGGCPVIISSQRGAVIVLIVIVVHQITTLFVLIIHKDFTSILW